MEEITIEDFGKNFDSYMKRVKDGESFLVIDPNGNFTVHPEEGDEIQQIYMETDYI